MKNKNKNRSEMEYLRGEVRKYRSENRQLKKRNMELQRQAHFYNESDNEPVVEDIDIKCPNCDKGVLRDHDFKYIVITRCNYCDYTKRQRKPNERQKETQS